MPKLDAMSRAIAVAVYLDATAEYEPFVDESGSVSDCCGRDVEYDAENKVWFCGFCGEPCGVL